MGKKIVVISSSPRRKGNSEVLCQRFSEGAIEAGHEVEIVNLNDYEIKPCLACEYCRSHDHQCVINDQADEVIDKIIESDVFVLSSPVYFYSLTAQLKLLIDRTFAREYEIRDGDKKRKSYLILTSGAPDINQMAGSIESYRGFIKVLKTVEDAGIIDGCGAFHKGDIQAHLAYDSAYQAGLNV